MLFSWFTVFLAVLIMDIVWALYAQSIAQGKRNKAALHASLIIVFGGFATDAYVHDLSLLVPAAAGAFVGTWITVGRK